MKWAIAFPFLRLPWVGSAEGESHLSAEDFQRQEFLWCCSQNSSAARGREERALATTSVFLLGSLVTKC